MRARRRRRRQSRVKALRDTIDLGHVHCIYLSWDQHERPYIGTKALQKPICRVTRFLNAHDAHQFASCWKAYSQSIRKLCQVVDYCLRYGRMQPTHGTQLPSKHSTNKLWTNEAKSLDHPDRQTLVAHEPHSSRFTVTWHPKHLPPGFHVPMSSLHVTHSTRVFS